MMADMATPQASVNAGKVTMLLGLVVTVLALVWWFAFYAQYEGAFRLLRLKAGCIAVTSMECGFFQEVLAKKGAAIPVYSPIPFFVGLVLLIVGVVLSRRKAVR